MIETGDVAQLRLAVQEWRRAGERIAFVPTMGNLHAGHYALVELAHRLCGRVIASVFVNPTQFGPNEDYARYPRTLAEDRAGLLQHGCDLLFVPEVATLYPYGSDATVRIEVPEVTQTLDGLARPGHFAGVATVVTKLFNMVQPDVAVFGQKDYQQVQVIRRMVRDLALPVEIVMAPTERAADGLALSSRNGYLSGADRAIAPELHRCLQRMAQAVRQGEPLAAIEAQALASLSAAGFVPDYATIRRDDSLSAPQPDQRNGLVALIAARLGTTRLIDNLLIQ